MVATALIYGLLALAVAAFVIAGFIVHPALGLAVFGGFSWRGANVVLAAADKT